MSSVFGKRFQRVRFVKPALMYVFSSCGCFRVLETASRTRRNVEHMYRLMS